MQGWLECYDAVLMLTRTAIPIDNSGDTLPEVRAGWFPYTMPFNLTGHPATTLPVGLAGDGLLLAMQLVGKFRGDADLLELAATLEARCGWNGRISGQARL